MSGAHEIAGTSALASLLQQHMVERGFTPGQLIARSGLSRSTVYRWLEGGSVRPYHRAGFLKLAVALDLARFEADRVLCAAGFPPLDVLARAHDPAEQASLAHWSRLIRNNLPAELTSFVGREQEITAVAELLCHASVRWVTLTGTGGAGKTRLALRVARAVLDVFPGGVFFVSLAAVSHASVVIPTIAETIGLRDVRDAALPARLIGWLHPRRVLLVLDNLEQLVESGPDISAVLHAAPHLKVLATSRMPLHVMGEFARVVDPLPVPRTEQGDQELRKNPAVDLFLQRAQAAHPHGEIADDEMATIGEICRRLDGIPLAIELAAARLREHPPATLLTAFPSRLDLSSDGPRGVPLRQQTLRDTIARSLDLLPTAARAFFIRLTVFVGGWTERAAQAVCLPADAPGSAAAPMLQTLVEAHLIEPVPCPGGASRYRMLETLREYGLERRAEAGAERELRERHARYFLALAEAGPAYVPETRRGDWYERIDLDRENMRAALAWAQTREDGEELVRLVAALWPYWHEYLRVAEGRHWVGAALTRGGPRPPAQRAWILTGASMLAASQTAYHESVAFGLEALSLWREVGDLRGQALILRQLGWVSYMTGKGEEALSRFIAALAQWRAAGDTLGIACGLSDLAVAHCVAGDITVAAPYLTEAAERYRHAHDELGLARVRRDQGLHALLSGDLAAATPLLHEAVDGLRASGGINVLPSAVLYLGTALCFAGRLDEALCAYAESLRTYEEIGDKANLALTLLGLAAVAHRQGDGVRAAVLCGAAHAVRQDHQAALPAAVETIYQRETALMRAQSGAARFDEAFADGAVMSAADAIAFARSGRSDE